MLHIVRIHTKQFAEVKHTNCDSEECHLVLEPSSNTFYKIAVKNGTREFMYQTKISTNSGPLAGGGGSFELWATGLLCRKHYRNRTIFFPHKDAFHLKITQPLLQTFICIVSPSPLAKENTFSGPRSAAAPPKQTERL